MNDEKKVPSIECNSLALLPAKMVKVLSTHHWDQSMYILLQNNLDFIEVGIHNNYLFQIVRDGKYVHKYTKRNGHLVVDEIESIFKYETKFLIKSLNDATA